MTWTDDYSGEMPRRQIDDATAEQLLAGRTVPAELESVATVMRALREVSAHPVRPSTTLREQMAAGVFTGSPVYTYQANPHGLLRRVVTALLVRVAGMRLATRLAAAAFAAAVLGLGTAGFAGTLPTPVQNRFETVVESVTPYQFPEKTASPRDDTRDGGPVDDESVGGGTEPGGSGDTEPGGVGEVPSVPTTPPATITPPPASPGSSEPGNDDGTEDDSEDGNAGGNGNGNGNAGGNGNGNGNGDDKGRDKNKPTEKPRE